MNGDQPVAASARSRFRRILGFSAFIATIAVAAFFLGWTLRPERVSATALFEVSRSAPNLVGTSNDRASDLNEYDIIKKTQLALLKSNFVLTSAIRDPKIGGLSLLHSQSDPVEWLQNSLTVDFPENGEILSISLSGAQGQENELVQIVDAVAKAYQEEVIEKQRAARLSSRDLLARNLDKLNVDIKRKLDEFLDIARESGRPEAGSGQVLQQLSANRLDRVEAEILRLESALAINSKEDSPERKAIDERITRLREQQTELAKELTHRVARSTDLEVRQRELEQLQQIAGDMSVKLQSMDIESSLPNRIVQVQPAVIVRN